MFSVYCAKFALNRFLKNECKIKSSLPEISWLLVWVKFPQNTVSYISHIATQWCLKLQPPNSANCAFFLSRICSLHVKVTVIIIPWILGCFFSDWKAFSRATEDTLRLFFASRAELSVMSKLTSIDWWRAPLKTHITVSVSGAEMSETDIFKTWTNKNQNYLHGQIPPELD